MRAVAYIDGFNLYHGLRNVARGGWGKSCYWTDVHRLVQQILGRDEHLVRTRYYTAHRPLPVKFAVSPQDRQDRLDSNQRQQVYLRALRENPAILVTAHRFTERDPVDCPSCGPIRPRFEEKQTDTRIATDVVADAALGQFDSAWIISADTDLVPPIERVKAEWPALRVCVGIPPGQREHGDLNKPSDRCVKIKKMHVDQARLPATIHLASGNTITQPPTWT